MKKFNISILMTATVLAMAPVSTPAVAQDSEPASSGGRCGSGFYRGGSYEWQKPLGMNDRTMCYRKPKSVEDAEDAKSDGPVYIPPTYGSVAKANKFDRCPIGYHTNENEMLQCVSFDYAAGKQPATRAKKGGACAANEIDEWGIWCTSKLTQLTRTEAEQEGAADVNRIYAIDGKGGNQGPEFKNTPGIIGIFGAEGTSQASASSGSGATDSADEPKKCDPSGSGSASGAAVGGAVAGQAGAVLGSVLGGLGKKKKKKNAC